MAELGSRHPPSPSECSRRTLIWVRRHAPLSGAVADGADDNGDGSVDGVSPVSPVLVSLCCSNGDGSSRGEVSFHVTLSQFVFVFIIYLIWEFGFVSLRNV